MVRALYPGSFDPVTLGHVNLIERGLAVFDEVTVAVAKNSQKNPLFTVEERVELLQQCLSESGIAGGASVQVVSFHGLVVDFCAEHGHGAILRGLRTVSDFEFEYQLALTNRHLRGDIETVFMMPSAEHSFVSSSLIKDIVRNGGDVSSFVPSAVEERLRGRLGEG